MAGFEGKSSVSKFFIYLNSAIDFKHSDNLMKFLVEVRVVILSRVQM